MSHEQEPQQDYQAHDLTEPQCDQLDARSVSDGELVAGGAKHLKNGRLELTAQQISGIILFDTPAEHLEAFTHTPESKRLNEQVAGMQDFKNTIGVMLGYGAFLPSTTPIKSFVTDEVRKVFGFDDSKINTSEMQRNRHLEALQQIINNDLRTTVTETKVALLRTPGLRFGATVSIIRGPSAEQPEPVQQGWLFTGIALNGDLIVTRAENGNVFTKHINATYAANNLVEKKLQHI